MILFNREKVSDERVENLKNKIYKEAFWIAIILNGTSILVKFYLYGINTEPVTTEFFIIVILLLYSAVRTVSLGIYSDEVELHDRRSRIPMGTKNVLSGFGSGFVIAIFFGIRSSVLYGSGGNRLWYFILVFITSILIYCPFFIATMMVLHKTAQKVSERISQRQQ